MRGFRSLTAARPGARVAVKTDILFIFLMFFCVPFIILALMLSPSLPVVTQIRGHIYSGPCPPSPPHYDCTCLQFYRENISAYFSLADSPRVVWSELTEYRITRKIGVLDGVVVFNLLGESRPV